MAIEYIRYERIPNEKMLKEWREHPYKYFTFDSAYTIPQLKKLRKCLITSNFIGKDITEAQFAHIFKGVPSTWITKIQWTDSKENLRFFLETLIPGTVHPKQVADCFVDPSGKPIQINKPNRAKEGIKKLKDTEEIRANPFKYKGKKLILQNIIFEL